MTNSQFSIFNFQFKYPTFATPMNKEETLELKGVAIMLMLWLHLFGTSADILEQCTVFIHLWNGDPLIYAMRKLGRMCIVTYIFLGGYGLSRTFERSQGQMHNSRRVLRLMVNYWVIFIPFVALASWLKPAEYPGNLTVLLTNFVGLNSSYNESWWFLLPYALLTLCAAPLLRFLYTLRTRGLIFYMALCVALNIGLYSLSLPDFQPTTLHMAVGLLITTVRFLFMFSAGALFARFCWYERLRDWTRLKLGSHTNLCMTLLLLFLAFGRICVGASTLIDPWFLMPMVAVFLAIQRPAWVTATLRFVGNHSTNVWLIHMSLLILTGSLIAQLRFPILIFLTLLAASIALSIPVKLLLNRVWKHR